MRKMYAGRQAKGLSGSCLKLIDFLCVLGVSQRSLR